MVLVRHPLIEGIVIVLDGSQHLAIGILWYRTITGVTLHVIFLLPRRWQFLRVEKIRKNILMIKKGGKCKRIVTTVPCHNLLWRQDLNMSDLNLQVEHIKFFFKNKQWQHNFLDLLLIVCWWKNNNDKRSSWYLWYMSQHAAHLGTIGDVCPIYSKYPGTPTIEQMIKSGTWTRPAQIWTMLFVFTNEEGWIFRTKFRRRKMLACPSSAFMIILISCLHLQRKKIWMGDKR